MNFFGALGFVDEVRAALGGDANNPIYLQFIRTLKEFRLRNVRSSIVYSTLQTLFRNHPALLDVFKAFKPRNCPAAVEDAGGDVTAASLDFMNRVKDRLGGGRVYSEFLNLMHAYSHRMIATSEAGDKVVGLLGRGNKDLVDEFLRFLPESKKRNMRVDDCDGESRTKRSRDQEERKKIMENRDNDMEDAMCDIDVRIWNLISCIESAERLTQRLSDGSVKAAEFRVAEHFTALKVACMRRLDKKIVEQLMSGDVVHALPHLMQILIKNKHTLEQKRLKISQSWTKLRFTNQNS